MLVDVYPDDFRIDPMPAAILAQYPQIVAATAADLADQYPASATQKLLQPKDADPVATQPGIDQIQLPQILFDIGKRNAVLIEDFLLVASLGKSGHAISFLL